MPVFAAQPVRHALEIARFAPSAHNTQPWRVTVQGERLVVAVDPRRHLAHSDPMERDLHLAMGGFVEALIIALRSEGLAAAPAEGGTPDGSFAALALSGACAPEGKEASLLRRRQTSRLAYSPREPEGAAIASLAAAARAEGLALHAVPRGTAERAQLEAWFFAATREAWLDARAVAELRAWLRFDPEGARAPADGLSTHCLGLGTLDGFGALLAARPAPWRAASALFAAPLFAEQLAATEAKAVALSPLIALLVAEREGAAGSSARSGAGLLRTWLAATELGLALHPISVLLDRRGWEVARHLGVATSRLMFACRLGRSTPPPRSGRLPVERFAKLPR